jgi:hypothetical protein
VDLAKAGDELDRLIERREKVVRDLRRMADEAKGGGGT